MPPQIGWGGERLVLLPQRAAFVPRHRTLLVADAHIGKSATFRRLGVPVPRGTTGETLARLDAALAATEAQQVIFLGDLLHSAHAESAGTAAAFLHWRGARAGLRLTLVPGNHDRRAGAVAEGWGVEVAAEPFTLGPLTLAHHPEPLPGRAVLAGHVHPCAVLAGRAHQRLRLPCFHFGERVGVLPAFGAFTGMHALPRGPGDRVFVVADEQVLELPA